MLNYLLISLFACTVAGSTSKPNFVIVLTDDQDVTIGGMTPMGNVQRFLANEGVTFENSYVASPICCPSRASILTGLYVHNHNTVNNSLDGGCYGASWMVHERRTFAAALNKAGYNTFYAGKYMNQYGVKEAGGPQRVPPGWSEWHGLVGNSVYYDYTISSNGVPTHSTDLYLTDVLRDLGVSYIENQTESQPFLMVVAPPAPHQPFTPAPRHRGRYANVTAVRQPNFNVSVDDKHWLMSMAPTPLPGSLAPSLDHAYRSRWEALLAVDELVADLVGVLETRGLLDNTYFVYTSDNGYHIGQFSQVYDKRQPYESDVRVPLVIRGPNIDKNTTSELPVLNIDLAPTILKLAGVEVPTYMDGHPIDLENKEFKERVVLIEYHGEGHGSVSADCPWKYDDINLSECQPEYDCKCQDSRNNTYGCIRYFSNFFNIKYCQFDDNDCFEELYDLTADPYELENVCEQTMPSLVLRYRGLLARMRQCTGANCDDPQPQGYYYPRNKCY